MRLTALILLCAAGLLAGDGPAERVVFTKSFPGSVPAWFSITVNQNGDTSYREDPKDESPMQFHLPPADTAVIFELAGKLDYFKRKLEAPVKVARMGDKTLHYEKGQQSSETTFNYTDDPHGRALTDWFEKISETERNLIQLQAAVKYDKLGVNDALLQVEIAWDKKRLVAPEQFLPMLDRIIKNESFMHVSRQRAENLANMIRGTK